MTDGDKMVTCPHCDGNGGFEYVFTVYGPDPNDPNGVIPYDLVEDEGCDVCQTKGRVTEQEAKDYRHERQAGIV